MQSTISNIDVADDWTISIDKSRQGAGAILREIAALAAAKKVTQGVTVAKIARRRGTRAALGKETRATVLAGAGGVHPGQ